MARLKMLGGVGSALLLAACGQLLGLGDYEVGEASSGGLDGSGGTGGTGGSGGTGGTGGDECRNDRDCEGRNDCSLGTCDDGTCVFEAADTGTECDDGGGVCNGDEDEPACVTCVDDASGSNTDSGCSDGAPECELNDDDEPMCTGCGSDSDCDDDNDCTEDTCDASTCANTALDAGEECADGVCNGSENAPACVACIDDAAGLNVDTGCSDSAPTCETEDNEPICIECFDDEDCDDGNACTDQDCISGFCEYTTLAEGDSCGDGQAGVCNGDDGDDACGACIDDAGDTEVDTGCTEGANICDTSVLPYQCTGCIENVDCDDDIPCTVDLCTSEGVCTNTPDNTLCDDAGGGTACDPITCTATEDTADGCEVTDGRHYSSLLVNGDFEAATQGWIEVDNLDIGIIWNDPYIGAQSGTWVAWMGGIEDAEHDVYQIFDVPPNALQLDVSFWWAIVSDENNAGLDTGGVEFREADAATVIYEFISWDASNANNAWEEFTETYDASGIAGDSISFYVSSVNSPANITDFFVDSVDVTAMCCGEPCEVN